MSFSALCLFPNSYIYTFADIFKSLYRISEAYENLTVYYDLVKMRPYQKSMKPTEFSLNKYLHVDIFSLHSVLVPEHVHICLSCSLVVGRERIFVHNGSC